MALLPGPWTRLRYSMHHELERVLSCSRRPDFRYRCRSRATPELASLQSLEPLQAVEAQ